MISRRLIRVKVLQVLYAFLKKNDSTSSKSEKELFHSIDKFYDLYHLLLLLIIEIVELEKNSSLDKKLIMLRIWYSSSF